MRKDGDEEEKEEKEGCSSGKCENEPGNLQECKEAKQDRKWKRREIGNMTTKDTECDQHHHIHHLPRRRRHYHNHHHCHNLYHDEFISCMNCIRA